MENRLQIGCRFHKLMTGDLSKGFHKLKKIAQSI